MAKYNQDNSLPSHGRRAKAENDEARRVSEDMQQFHSNHRDADLTDHYYWDDVLDAETDEYLEDF